MAREYVVPITWQMRGFVKVKAESLEEAIASTINTDDIPIPTDSQYVDGSLEVESDDEDRIRMYTEAYDNGDLDMIPEQYEEDE